ncbi:hypothetical protein ACJW30_05G017600 [Castanea mollissima]
MISIHLHHTQLLCILLSFTETKPKIKNKSINQFAMFLNLVYSIKYSCAHNEMLHGPEWMLCNFSPLLIFGCQILHAL